MTDAASTLAGRPTKSPRRLAVILAALRQYPLLNRAARLGGIRPRTLGNWRHDDPEFRADVEEALDEGIERIELRAHEDAIEGTDREATLQRMFTLKRWRPEYRDNVTVHHRGGGQDARDAALLRRAMVESLGPYPEARAALAAALARLGGADDDGPPPALPTSSTSPKAGGDDVQVAEVVDAELVEVVSAAGEGSGSRAAGDEHAGGEEEESRASTRGGGRPGAGVGPVLSPSPSTSPYKRVLSFDNAVIETHSVKDDEDSGNSHSGG
jgi:hypothetical protein